MTLSKTSITHGLGLLSALIAAATAVVADPTPTTIATASLSLLALVSGVLVALNAKKAEAVVVRVEAAVPAVTSVLPVVLPIAKVAEGVIVAAVEKK